MLKYLLLVIIILILWITEPMWRAGHITGHSAAPDYESDDIPTETYHNQKKEVKPLSEAEKKFIAEFGNKPAVDYDSDTPYVVKEYWKKVYKHPERILPLSCTRLEMSPKGWKTTCNFKTKEHSSDSTYELQQEIYYIKNGAINNGSSSRVNLN